jgi:nicotinamidase-related amidase
MSSTTPALLLMDYQEGICREDGVIGRSGMGRQALDRDVLGAAARVLKTFREQDLPRVFVRVAFDPAFQRMTSASPRFQSFRDQGLMVAGSPEAEICHEVGPLWGEPVVDKGCVIPFIGTHLMQLLTNLGVGHVVLGGVATNQVVEGTARYAADSGLQVTVLEDLCAGATAEMHAFSVANLLPSCGAVVDSEAFTSAL